MTYRVLGLIFIVLSISLAVFEFFSTTQNSVEWHRDYSVDNAILVVLLVTGTILWIRGMVVASKVGFWDFYWAGAFFPLAIYLAIHDEIVEEDIQKEISNKVKNENASKAGTDAQQDARPF